MQNLLRPTIRRPRGDAGMTLVELLVTMIVFTLALAMVFTALIVVQGKTRQVEASAEAVSQVRHALAQIDRQVRSGNVLYSPSNETTAGCTSATTNSGTCMRIYTQTNGLAECVQWQVLPDPAKPGTSYLRSRTWEPATGAITQNWGTVARGLVGSPSVEPFSLEGAATAYNSRLLNVRLEALDERRNAPVVITSSLSGRNTNYGYDAGQCTPVPPA